MSIAPSLRERQAPLKARYEADPASATLTITVRSTTDGNDPTRSRISSGAGGGVDWEIGAHPYAGGEGDLACSGDLLLASLAACQEITLRMVAAAMGITLDAVELTVQGDMDFRGTMGVDPETPVGFQTIRTAVKISANVPADRLERLFQRAERYCVVNATLRNSPIMETSFSSAPATQSSNTEGAQQ
ncbi:MAG: OsmC family protein [Thermomicrobiales bacterium]